MEFVFILLVAGIIIWIFNIAYNKKDNTLHTNEPKNDTSFRQTIPDKNSPSVTATNPTSVSDTKLTNVISLRSDGKSEQRKRPDADFIKNGQWISPDRSINVAEYAINGGMIYLGKNLPAACGYGKECSLIDPGLKVDRNNDDYLIRRLNYWPSYSEASPDARAAYLKWLSTGKNDPNADIGYVFLYFYGIERRLLYDTTQGLVSDAEVQILIDEVNRLLSIYSKNGSFYSYANSLLSYVQADLYSNIPQYNKKTPVHTQHFGLPLTLKICLGQMVNNNMQIPGEWALAWYLSTPNPPVYTRTPAHRCQQEFYTLFGEEYTRNYGPGLRLKDNKTRIKIEHRPASKSLLNNTYVKTLDLPDVTKQTSFIIKIAPLIQICQDKLDSYSRYLGRNPEGKDTLDAILELPVSVWPNNIKEYLNSLQTKLSHEDSITMSFSTLLEHFPNWQDKSKKRLTQFFECLELYHIGMEPDLRYSGIKPEMGMPISLFYLEEASPNIRPAYGLAALTMHLAAMVSQSDGEVSQAEINVLEHQIERSLELNQPEIKRLKMHLHWLLSQPLSVKGMKKRIQSLEIGDRELIGDLLIQVSQADGMVSAREIKLLEKIFVMLEIDSDLLYSKIHSSYAEPRTVKQTTAASTGFSIPLPPRSLSPSEGKLALDMSKVAALHTDTKHITTLLSTIFNPNEEEQKVDIVETDASKGPEHIKSWGLAPSIYQFVEILMTKSTWKRRELEELAYNKSLMLEGALEQINEVAFEHFDQPFIEGEDPLEINQEIVAVMN